MKHQDLCRSCQSGLNSWWRRGKTKTKPNEQENEQMTWSLQTSGHHNTSDWVAEEHDLLREFVKATEAKDTITTNFRFNGNHVQAESLDDARAKLAEYDSAE
jgi:hypothetical protein